MRRIPILLPIALLSAALVPAPAAAQELTQRTEPGPVVERIIAVVGDSTVTLTELQEYLLMLETQGELPTDPAEMARIREEAIESLIDQLMVVQAAAMDSTFIPGEDEIEARVSEMMQRTAQGIGGAARLQEALAAEGMTQAEYREQLKQRIRREQISQLYFRAKMREAPAVAVSEADMREMFEARKVQIGERPELVTIRQAVVTPAASDSAWSAAKVTIDSIVARLREGENFDTLAQRHSMDGSAPLGGDLGWFRRGQMVREFEEVAFRLPIGRVSDPVRTQHGWHLIKVDRTRPGEVNARHILIRPATGPTADARVRATAEEIARRARAGEGMRSLIDEFADQLDKEVPDSVSVPRAQMAEGGLPPAYRQPLAAAAQGDVVGPFTFPVRDQTSWVVVEVVEMKPAGPYTFEELKPQIEAQLTEERQIERLLVELRARTYIDPRP